MAIAERDFLRGPEPQFIARQVGWDKHRVIGVVLCFWDETQHRGIVDAHRSEVERYFDVPTNDDAQRLFDAMLGANLLSANDDGTIRIKGNAEHVAKLEELRGRTSAGGKARAMNAIRQGGRFIGRVTGIMPAIHQQDAGEQPAATQPDSSLSPGVTSPASASVSVTKERSKKDPDPDCAVVEDSSLAAPVASLGRPLVVDDEPPKRKAKKRDPDKAQRSQLVNRLYRQRYEEKKHHEPSGMDAAFNSTIARFADKHGDNAFAIVDWFFDSPNPKYRNEHYALWLLVRDADKLWGEVNNKRTAMQGIAAPVADRQLAVSVNNALVIEEVLSVMPQIPANNRPLLGEEKKELTK